MKKPEKHYWITKEGIPVEIDKMTVPHLRNALHMIIRESRARKKVADATTLVIGRNIFMTSLNHGKTWIFLMLILSLVKHN